MTLKLYFHPLASYCHKVLIALYEHDIAFEPILVDLGDEKSSAAFRALWPLAKFPVLCDEARNCTVAESSHYRVSRRRGATLFWHVPDGAKAAGFHPPAGGQPVGTPAGSCAEPHA
jgi:hypothetical protein